MTHLPFIAAAYGLTVIVVIWLTADAFARTRRARIRLRALDPREARR
jgi:heme exporter protein D